MSRHATVAAYTALALSLAGAGGSAYAATGGTFLLGKANSASTITTLSNSAGTALSLKSKAGTAPLAVNGTTKVTNLNADLLDGLNSSSFRRAGVAVVEVKADLSYAAQPFGTVPGDVGWANCPAGTTVVSVGFTTSSSWAVRQAALDVANNRAWVRLDHSKPSDSSLSAGYVRAYCLK